MNLENILLKDVMTRGVMTVSMDIPVKEVAYLMSNQHVSGIAVVDHTGEIMGVISEMDILKTVNNESLLDEPAESIMNYYVQSVKPTTSLKVAAEMMMKHGYHRLIVLSESGVGASNRPIGILSASDIVRTISHAR
ncbi:MAG: CBS domain-containing protein [ANME-2 cluster archaeon]|nr:CBS domain-containing protein [ANME-2 cluster archaeon]MCL7474631.1 CBS domain-containing protein [ANME-2 cluster archaeon]MDF1531060.1 CBS domain-containing protein [ANME-2 cluster archaeon]